MKTLAYLIPVILLLVIATGCSVRTVYEPVYMSYTELRVAVAVEPPQDMGETGKIYLKDNYVFVNERNAGVHVIDNTDPAHPRIIAFINIPGNIDIAIRDNVLYADSYIDLVALDITDPRQVTELHRIENAFPFRYDYYQFEPDFNWYDYQGVDPGEGIVVGWEESSEWELGFEGIWVDVAAPDLVSGEGGSSTGTGGSLACFTIVGDYLYTVDSSTLRLFDISQPAAPATDSNINLGWDIETIFPCEGMLFIGSMSGMYVYDISTPSNPEEIVEFTHATSCDPVVAGDNYAYITLRSGTFCGGGQNILKIVDISDIENPLLIKDYAMNNPFGVGIDGNTLFVCDSTAGLKVYDCTDKTDLQRIAWFRDYTVHDVIPCNGIAIVVGENGLYQFDYQNPANITLLSSLATGGGE